MEQTDRTQQGLYRPEFEHDSCGTGFLTNINGQKSNQIILDALTILENMEHRGACGCDPLTGDGAGILTQIPHAFFQAQCAELGIELPAPGDYGMGTVFLPPDPTERQACQNRLDELIAAEGQRLLGWRDV